MVVVVTEIIAASLGRGETKGYQLGEKLTDSFVCLFFFLSFDGRSFGGATRFWWVGEAESSRTKVGGGKICAGLTSFWVLLGISQFR